MLNGFQNWTKVHFEHLNNWTYLRHHHAFWFSNNFEASLLIAVSGLHQSPFSKQLIETSELKKNYL